jgi:hypothetical protein
MSAAIQPNIHRKAASAVVNVKAKRIPTLPQG